uniref:UDP-glucuronosyltransferase n=1 Tax=Anopheles atroparvus TaxID=41427 RepID=A0A182JIB1_ANOAO
MAKEGPIPLLRLMHGLGLHMCEAAIKSEGLRFLLNYPKDFKFDLFVNDFMVGPCLPAIIMHRFKDVPYIPATSYNAPSTGAPVLGSFAYSGLVPNHVYDVPEEMNFVQRVKNLYYDVFEMITHETNMHPEADRILRTLYPSAPSTYTFYKNVRVSFINANPIIQYKEPMMPNMIPRLPQYQFLWKFESDESKLPMAVPKNVYIRAWMPQNDLLAHPNIKLFITHSGLLSTQEAIWHGVPVIGFPLFADQFRNINYCVAAGIAKRLRIQNFKANDLIDAIKEILGEDNVALRNVW